MARLVTNNNGDSNDLTWIESIWQRPISRAFWIYDVPSGQTRGKHRHEDCHMVLQCVVGTVSVYVQTPKEDEHFLLDSINKYLFLAPHDWRLMYDFSSDALLMVITDKTFEETTYIEEPYRLVNTRPAEMM